MAAAGEGAARVARGGPAFATAVGVGVRACGAREVCAARRRRPRVAARVSCALNGEKGDRGDGPRKEEEDGVKHSVVDVEGGGGGGQYEDFDPKMRESMLEIDKAAEQWIGTDLNRLYWYEDMKARRFRLQKIVKEKEGLVEKDMTELRETLKDLDTLVNVGFLDERTGEITSVGWGVVLVSFLTNVAIFVAIGHVLSKALTSAFPPSPF